MINRIQRARAAEFPSDDEDDSLPQFGPPFPYDTRTLAGRHRAERRDCPDVPTLVDRWLDANRCSWIQPDPRLVTTRLFTEMATYEVEMIYTPEVVGNDLSDPFIEEPAYMTLFLTITLDDRSGVQGSLLRSPRCILERCINYGSYDSPDWAEGMSDGQIVTFTQPRCIVSESFAMLATSTENITLGYAPAMLRWAQSVSVAHQARVELRRNTHAQGAL